MKVALIAQQAGQVSSPADGTTAEQASRVTSLATALAGAGHQVTVYARRASAKVPDSVRLAPGATIEYIQAGPAVALTAGEFVPHVRDFAGRLAERWRRDTPDIVDAHYWTSGLAAMAAARDLGIPVVQTFGSLGIAERRAQLPEAGPGGRIRAEAYVARGAASVLAASAEELADLGRLGVTRAAVSVVPCGIDTTAFTDRGRPAEPRKRPRLLAVGPLSYQYGFDTLIRALAEIPGAELVIAGGPPRKQLPRDPGYRALSGYAAAMKVRKRIEFAGQVSAGELPELYRGADVVVCPARHDPMGVTAIQAMACGTPVVATAVGGQRDAVVHGITGVLVPPGRPDILARQTRDLLGQPLRLGAFGFAATDRAQARYGWERIAIETAAAYGHAQCRRARTTIADLGEFERAAMAAGDRVPAMT